MQVWAITIPCTKPEHVKAHRAFHEALLHIFGGLSAHGGAGAWRDDRTGEVFREANIRYEIAVPVHAVDPALARLASNYFPEERAFYVACTGTAEIVDVR